MNFKKKVCLLTLLLIVLMGLIACGNVDTGKKDGELSIICTIFPQYDFAREIIGNNPNDIEITYLLESGVDVHNFQASAEDMVKIQTCDLFVYVGGQSEKWVEDVKNQSGAKNVTFLSILDIVDIKEEEIIEGMEEEEHNHGEENHERNHDDEGAEYDEHVWLSLRNAELMVNAICDEICSIDKANADYYRANADAYIEKLKELDQEYETMVEGSKVDTILVADRFPFRYLVDDYNIEYCAAFVGCSAETEATFETVAFLSNKIEQYDLDEVIIIDKGDGSIARTIIDNSNKSDIQILTLNSLQSVSKEDIGNGVNYLDIMKDNYVVLEKALYKEK